MSIPRSHPLLCFIHNAESSDPPEGLWELPDETWDDVDLIQVRGKELDDEALRSLAEGWIERTADLSCRVIVNDRLDVAVAAVAEGVHLGEGDESVEEARERAPEDFLIGATGRDINDVLIAQARGADYVGLGAVFESPTKPDVEVVDPWRAGLMAEIPALKIPVIAVGGMTPDRVGDAFRMWPVTGIAASSAIQGADDPAGVVESFRRAMDRAWESRKRVSAGR